MKQHFQMVRIIVTVLLLGAPAYGQRWINPLCKKLDVPNTICGFVELGDGSLLMVKGNATVISSDGGKTWSKPRPIYTGSEKTGVPPDGANQGKILKTRDGVIVLIYCDGYDIKWQWDRTKREATEWNLDVWAIRSLDEGQTWTDRQKLLDGYNGSALDIIQTQEGQVVAVVQDYIHPGRHGMLSYVSSDNGRTWKASNLIDMGGSGDHDGAIEATLVQLKDGRVWMLLRTNWDRFWEAFSDDNGQSWRTIRPSNIQASSAPGYITRLASGRLVLLWNQLYPEGLTEQQKKQYPRRGKHYCSVPASWHRSELSIAFSSDEGKTWSKPTVVAREPDKWGRRFWLAYPYLYERQPGLLWIFTGQGSVSISGKETDLLQK